MAAIDKTYTNSYKNYTDLIEWARNNKFTCPNGTIVNVLNSIYSNWTKEDFNKAINEGHTLPVMNTSQSTDYYLIKYCPLQFVQDRMIEVYDEDYYNTFWDRTSNEQTWLPIDSEFVSFVKYRNIKTTLQEKGYIELAMEENVQRKSILWFYGELSQL